MVMGTKYTQYLACPQNCNIPIQPCIVNAFQIKTPIRNVLLEGIQNDLYDFTLISLGFLHTHQAMLNTL